MQTIALLLASSTLALAAPLQSRQNLAPGTPPIDTNISYTVSLYENNTGVWTANRLGFAEHFYSITLVSDITGLFPLLNELRTTLQMLISRERTIRIMPSRSSRASTLTSIASQITTRILLNPLGSSQKFLLVLHLPRQLVSMLRSE